MSFGKVIKVLRREVARFEETSLSQVSRQKSPYKVLISCILSLRTKDAVTLKASERLFALAVTPEKMLRLSEKQIQEAIYPVAFYRVKAKNIKKISSLIIKKYKNRVPSTLEKLLTLPNVGRKTANIVITHGFGKHGIAVDTHVHRLSNRIGFVRTKTPDQTEFALRELLPKKYWIEYNDLLVTWGQNICTPVSPWCSKCKLNNQCKRIGVVKSR